MARARMRAGVRAGAWASKTVLKIYCKSGLEYLGISVVAARNFGLGNLVKYLENSNLGDRKESRGVMERRSWQGQLRFYTEVILVLIFSLKYSLKWAGWPVGYKEIRIIKERSLVPDLLICYSKNAQRNWIKCLRLRLREQKCKFLKSVKITFLRK